ncbi:hypothetical protein BMF94_6467 [Rhodotorula taiwanensis]|uniref:Carbonic anhydrase n=1 Tax=Rhodotorula taiwanensis TaxID=741276 RepID=A0A2S5B1A2_9BASI|nr:hypothetical protein BMF94_6467 [Rhodotorula taiwanensis]
MLYSPALASRTLAKYTVPAAAPFAFAARSAVLGFHHSDSSRRRHHFRPQQVASRSHSTRATMTASTQLLQGILDANETYAAAFAQSDPALLKKLAQGQAPKIFWLGCSDSRVSAELATGVAPGSIFVHRNIAQCFHPGDPSASAALAYAVHVLKVEAIIVCGHTGCGGVKAGMQAAVDSKSKEDQGEKEEAPKPGSVEETIAKWIAPIKHLATPHANNASDPLSTLELGSLTDEHVKETVKAVAESDLVRAAWDEGRELSVHGWVYHVATAKLRDLDCGYKGPGVKADSLSRPSTYADSDTL